MIFYRCISESALYLIVFQKKNNKNNNCHWYHFIKSGNGTLSREEFGAHTGVDFIFKDPIFDYFDTNHDGVLSKDEFVEKPYADMNQNGMLKSIIITICNINTYTYV